MPDGPTKAEGAFRTIGEVSQELGVPQHILRYWETRFPQLRPLQRAGNRRYYRPADVALVKRIDRLLNHEGYTIRGVQKLLADKTPETPPPAPAAAPPAPPPAASPAPLLRTGYEVKLREELRQIRDDLRAALDAR